MLIGKKYQHPFRTLIGTDAEKDWYYLVYEIKINFAYELKYKFFLSKPYQFYKLCIFLTILNVSIMAVYK